MNIFFRLVCNFEILTPLFLGGASQEAELRVPSIKGMMRFWYRALDPSFDANEPLLFGSGGPHAGQSLLRLRCRPGDRASERMRWRDARAEQFNQGSGRQTKNGLVYLGFPLAMKGKSDDGEERTAIPAGARFSVEVSCHGAAPDGLKGGASPLRAALASMWALGHWGSLGTRSRRGFGALALTDWRLEDHEGRALPEPDLADLPLQHQAPSHREWMTGAKAGLDVARRWFPSPEQREAVPARLRHPHFGPQADFTVSPEKVRREDWRGAVLALGRSLQDFRQRRQPDYDMVKDHVLFESREGGRRIQRAPERAAFGLPLTFRYGSLPRGRPVTFAPVDGERHGSLLFLRPVTVGDGLSSLFLRLDGEVPAIDTPAGVRGTHRSLDPARHNAMDEFVLAMKGKADR